MKYLFILTFSLSLCFCQELFDIEILKNDTNLSKESIKNSEEFEKVSLPMIIQNDESDYYLKIDLKEEILYEKSYILTFQSPFSLNEIELFDENEFSFIDKNSLELPKDFHKTIYLRLKNRAGLIYFNVQLSNKEEFFSNKELKNRLIGVAYGVVFTAFFYYFIFFLYNKKRINLYYSITQFFSLLILIFSQNTNYFKYDFISLGFVIFSILFTKEFLETKKYTPKIDKFFNILLLLFVINTFYSFDDIFPIALFLLLYPISALIVYIKTKRKPILFYLLAWGMVIFTFIFITIEVFIKSIFGVFIDFSNILHTILPLESIILAFVLSYSMKVNEDEKNEKERLLIHQNKLASIGEMINNIAHQWRQPLTHLNYVFMNLNMAQKHKKLTKEYLEDKTKEATNQLTYMSKTIDIFKDFYTPHMEKEEFSVKSEINSALQIVSSTFEKEKIRVIIFGDDFKLFAPKGELSQVLMNILTNSKDAFVQKRIKEPYVKIVLEKNMIKIFDNGGGIEPKIASKIFSPYFSTKKRGSGIGLYMSKLIIEKHFNGKISHKNRDLGTLFLIEF